MPGVRALPRAFTFILPYWGGGRWGRGTGGGGIEKQNWKVNQSWSSIINIYSWQRGGGVFFFYMQKLCEYSKRCKRKESIWKTVSAFFSAFISYNLDSYLTLKVFLTIQKELGSIIRFNIYIFPESSPFFLLLFSFLTVFNTQCCFLAVRFSSHKPICAQTEPSGRKASQGWLIFLLFFSGFSFVFEGRVVGHLSNLPCIVLRKEQKGLSCRWVVNNGVPSWRSVRHTCGKPLLVERKSVAAALKFHISSWQGGALVQKLHCQSGGGWGAVGKFKLGPQCSSPWGQTDI